MIHWPRTIKPLVLLAALAAALALVPSASASSCGSRAVSQPFAAGGDTNDYFRLAGGGFENSLDGWTLASGNFSFGYNQPWWLDGQQTGNSSVRLYAGASLVSQSFCAARDENVVRMFVRNSGRAGSWLRVTAHVETDVASWDEQIGWFDGASKGWSLSPQMTLWDMGTASDQAVVTLMFETGGSWGVWGIDDVYVDPFRST